MELVVNWHILEKCNFSCGFCFAHYERPQLSGRVRAQHVMVSPAKEVWRDPMHWKALLEQLSKTAEHVLGNWGRLRLNIAGGEPLILWKNKVLPDVMDYAVHLNFSLSIITNGYFLSDNNIVKELAQRVNLLGISMDSASSKINHQIGRCDKNGRQISPQKIADIFKTARKTNPCIECKLNTVVNSKNWRENMREAVALISPDRWKVFQMLPIPSHAIKREDLLSFEVSDKQFQKFLKRHGDVNSLINEENNETMVDSYIMVDPYGRFCWNDSAQIGSRREYSAPIQTVGIAKAIKQIKFSRKKFNARYDM